MPPSARPLDAHARMDGAGWQTRQGARALAQLLHGGKVRMTIEPGIYEHFKGQRYEVFGTARHSETEEVFVSYRKLYDDYSYWVRPVEMFTGTVERDGYSGPRFRRIA